MTENTAQPFRSGSFHGEVANPRAAKNAANVGPVAGAPKQGPANAKPQHAKVPRLNRTKKSILGILGLAQLGLATAAGLDLARRDPKRIHGPKAFWYSVLPINWLGPIAYFLAGRKLGR